jgi:hypothetical protein
VFRLSSINPAFWGKLGKTAEDDIYSRKPGNLDRWSVNGSFSALWLVILDAFPWWKLDSSGKGWYFDRWQSTGSFSFDDSVVSKTAYITGDSAPTCAVFMSAYIAEAACTFD